MVDAVEPFQQLGVGLAALDRVDQGELAGGQVADAAADVAEHLGDVAAAEHLAFQQRGRGRLHPVEGLGEVADLVARGDRHLAQPGRAVVLGVVVGDPGQLTVRDLGDLPGGAGEGLHRPDHRAADHDRQGEPEGEAEQGKCEQQSGAPGGVPGGVLGAVGDLVDEGGGDPEPDLGLLPVGGVGDERGLEGPPDLVGGVRLEGARVDLEFGVLADDEGLRGTVLDPAQLLGLLGGGEPGETVRLVGVHLVRADRADELDERVGVTGGGGEHPGLEGAVGGVGAQQRVQQIAGEGGRETGVAVQAQAVDDALGGVGVRRIDVVRGEIALLDGVPEAAEGADLLERPRLGLRQPVAEGLPDLDDLGVHRGLRPVVGVRGGRGGALTGRFVPYGEQDGLLVLGLHPVHQRGHLGAVPDQPGRVGCLGGLVELVVDEVGEQHGHYGERHADQEIELAAEGPTVDEAPYAERGIVCRGGRVHLFRGHHSSWF